MDLDGAGKLADGRNGPVLYPVLASAIASILTGTALVATRYVVRQADGLTIAMPRYVLAALCLLPLVPTFHRFDVARRDVLPIVALGVLYFGLFPWCIGGAMQYTTPTAGEPAAHPCSSLPKREADTHRSRRATGLEPP